MRVLIIGAGSIGKRRARLLDEMGHDVMLCDTRDPEPEEAEAWYPDLTEALDSEIVAAFICTPAASHVDVAKAVVSRGIPVFAEKPLSTSMDGVQDLLALRSMHGVPAMGACNMRFAYHLPDQRWRHLHLTSTKPLSAWRPGAEEAYRANGIMLEMAIHEIDVAIAHLGMVAGAEVEGDADTAVIRLQHSGLSGRTSRIDVSWAEGAGTMRYVNGVDENYQHYAAHPDLSDAMYVREMEHFLECVRTRRKPCCDLGDAATALGWALHLQRQLKAAQPQEVAG